MTGPSLSAKLTIRPTVLPKVISWVLSFIEKREDLDLYISRKFSGVLEVFYNISLFFCTVGCDSFLIPQSAISELLLLSHAPRSEISSTT